MDKNVKAALIIGGTIAAVLIILSLVPGLLWGWQGHGYGMMGGFGTMFFMPVLWIIILGLIIWAVVAAVRPGESSGPGPTTASSALEILKKRYARGEIDKDEYEEKKKGLT